MLVKKQKQENIAYIFKNGKSLRFVEDTYDFFPRLMS